MDDDSNAIVRKISREANKGNNERRGFRQPRAAVPFALADALRDTAAVCRWLAEHKPEALPSLVSSLVASHYDLLRAAASDYRMPRAQGLRARADRVQAKPKATFQPPAPGIQVPDTAAPPATSGPRTTTGEPRMPASQADSAGGVQASRATVKAKPDVTGAAEAAAEDRTPASERRSNFDLADIAQLLAQH